MEIEIVTPEEAEKCGAVICTRVADAELVVAGSRKETCSTCAEPVFVAQSSPLKPHKICVQCALGEFGPKQ